jgi:fumarylpyruvate hydrolase
MKPADAVVPPGPLTFPVQTQELHHEVELVVALGKGGRGIAEDEALDHVFGYAVGLDMTRRDLRTAEEIGHPAKGAVCLRINGELRQEGDLDQQIWKVPETISYLSTLVTLRAGDLIMTGTPSGVGPVEQGDRLEGHIDGVGDVTVTYEG